MRLFITTSCLLSLAFLTACSSPQAPVVQKPAADGIVKRSNELYSRYLTGNASEARNALGECVRLMEDAQLPGNGRVLGLYLTYCRLYTLEKRTGNQAAAEVSFIKARYWNLRKLEINGSSAEEAMAGDKTFTPQSCIEFVDKWDKNHTGGKGPKYAEEAGATPAK